MEYKIKMSEKSREILEKGLSEISDNEKESMQVTLFQGMILKSSIDRLGINRLTIPIDASRLSMIEHGAIEPTGDDLVKILRVILNINE